MFLYVVINAFISETSFIFYFHSWERLQLWNEFEINPAKVFPVF